MLKKKSINKKRPPIINTNLSDIEWNEWAALCRLEGVKMGALASDLIRDKSTLLRSKHKYTTNNG